MCPLRVFKSIYRKCRQLLEAGKAENRRLRTRGTRCLVVVLHVPSKSPRIGNACQTNASQCLFLLWGNAAQKVNGGRKSLGGTIAPKAITQMTESSQINALSVVPGGVGHLNVSHKPRASDQEFMSYKQVHVRHDPEMGWLSQAWGYWYPHWQ